MNISTKNAKTLPMRTYKGKITSLPENGIFCFGANVEGRHGLGAAKVAREKFGAVYGQGFGLQGRSFGIVTKDLRKEKHPSVSKLFIVSQILALYLFAEQNKHLDFYVAYSGDGNNLNGFTSQEMAEMFFRLDSLSFNIKIPDNIIFEEKFTQLKSPAN